MRAFDQNKHNMLCVLSCVLAGITELLNIISSLLMGDAIDLSLTGQLTKLLHTCLLFLVLAVGLNLIFAGSVYLNLLYTHKSTTTLRDCLIKSFFDRDLHRFREKNDAYYVNLLNADAEKVCNSYYLNRSPEFKFLVLFLGSIIAMARIHFVLFLVSMVFALIPYGITWLFETRVQKQVKKTSAASEACEFSFLQLIQGYETFKLSGLDLSGMKERTHDTIWEKAAAQIRQEMLQGGSWWSIDAVNTIGKLVLLGVGGWLIVKGRITAGQLVSCTVLTTYVCTGVNNYLELHLARSAAKPLLKKIETEISVIPGNKLPYVDVSHYDVSYEHVSFRFDGGPEDLFHDISFSLEEGGCYAIVGESGKGKTTLIKLLLKYYPNYQGTITLFGHDIAAYSEEQLYQLVGVLNQNEFILNADLHQNITLFSEYISEKDSEYLSLLDRLNLSDLAKRTGNKPLGDFGDGISGGERQRIALARVLLKKPKLLILDEPTTGLDPENRNTINEIIKGLDDLTRIVITHDQAPDYLSQFDKVLHLGNDGTIRVERGQ